MSKVDIAPASLVGGGGGELNQDHNICVGVYWKSEEVNQRQVEKVGKKIKDMSSLYVTSSGWLLWGPGGMQGS